MSLPDGRSISSLKVTDLKRELEKRGLSKSGVKRELIERLETSLEEEEKEHNDDSSSPSADNESEEGSVKEVEDSNNDVNSSKDGDEANGPEVQEDVSDPPLASPKSEENALDVVETVNEATFEDKNEEEETEKVEVVACGGGDDVEDAVDHEILQGNVSDDEAITGHASPKAQPGSSAIAGCGDEKEKVIEAQPSVAADAGTTDADNDELEEGEMRDEDDERNAPKVNTSRAAAEKQEAAEKDLGASCGSGLSNSGGGSSASRKRQWGIRRPSAKTYVEVPLSSQALNTLVEMPPNAMVDEEEVQKDSRPKSESTEAEEKPVEMESRQVIVEEPMEEGEVPSTPASEMISCSTAPQLAISSSDVAANLDELPKRESDDGSESRIKMRLASPPAASPVTHDASPPKMSPTAKSKKKGLRETRAVGYHVEDPIRGREPEPATQPVSDTVHIRGLVRPFTLNQLKDLLSRFGNIQGFWIDRVKSKAFVRFESSEEAKSAREDLDGCKWPSINPRLLRVDFSSQEELEWMTENGESGRPFPKAPVVEAAPSRAHPVSGRTAHVEAEKPERGEARKSETEASGPGRERARERGSSPSERKRARGKINDSPSGGRERDGPATKRSGSGTANVAPVREWDRDKIRQSDSPPSRRPRRPSRSPPSGRDKPSKGSGEATRDISKERPPKEKEAGAKAAGPSAPAAKEEPARLLDDLFRKTKVVPSVYWLPLTEEQIKAKQREREERNKVRHQQYRESGGADRPEAPTRAPLSSGYPKGSGVNSAGRQQAAGGRRRSRTRSRSRSRRREWDSRRR